MKVPPPRPEEEGIPVILRIPGVLDALLFWSLFASTSVFMLWLLTSTFKNILRETVMADIYTQTVLLSETLSLTKSEPSPAADFQTSRLLASFLDRNDILIGASVWMHDGTAWRPETQSARPRNESATQDPRIPPLLDAAQVSRYPQFSRWDFIQKNRLPLFTEIVKEPEYGAHALKSSTDSTAPPRVLVLTFDAPRIQEKFMRVDWTAATVISISIIIATLLSLLVRRRSKQREEAERERLEAIDLLGRRDAILAKVAASADDMLKTKDVSLPCAALMESIREVLHVRAAYACLAPVNRPFTADPVPSAILGAATSEPPLVWEHLERTGLQDWKPRLLSSQPIHGPLELLPDEERLEIVECGIANFALIPVLSEATLTGIVVIVDDHKGRTWEPGLLDTLRLAADLIGASFGRQEQEQRLMESGKMQALGRMAGGVAHEFNNLLHIISGNLRRLGRDAMTGSSRHDLVEKMIETSERGSRIVEQLLSATRQTTPALRPTQLNDVVQKTVYLAQSALRKDVQLRLNLDPQLPKADMDPAQIQQVILNLLINANDAIEGSGIITLSTGLTSASENGSEYIYCAVTDTGTGIHPRDEAHLFDPFFTTKAPGKGTGLGLSTSRGILELHQGTITAANHEPRGAVFTFYLPVAPSKTTTQRISLPTADETPMHAGRVLIADDEPLCVDVLKDTLEEYHFECFTAANGDQALELARQYGATIDWVITDWTMPGIHGRDLVRALRELLPHAGIVVSSGFVLEDEEIPEIDGLVVKPFNPHELIRKLGQVAEQRADRVGDPSSEEV